MSDRRRRVLRIVGRALLVLVGVAVGLKVADLIVKRLDPMGVSHFANLATFNDHCTEYRNIGPPGHRFIMQFLMPDRVVQAGSEYRINSLGARGRDYALEKPADTWRIVVLGDSVTFGWGIEVADRYTDVVEGKLDAERPGGKRIEIINIAVPGYETKEHAYVFRRQALSLQADAIVVAFNLNDVQNETEEQVAFVAGTYERARTKSIWAPFFVEQPWKRWLESTLPSLRLLLVHRYIFVITEKDEAELRDRYAAMKGGCAISLQLLTEMRDRCRDAGIGFGVAMLHDLEPIRIGLAAANVPFRFIGEGVNLSALDLRNSAADPHPNAKGHALLAAKFEQMLRDLDLIPRAKP